MFQNLWNVLGSWEQNSSENSKPSNTLQYWLELKISWILSEKISYEILKLNKTSEISATPKILQDMGRKKGDKMF